MDYLIHLVQYTGYWGYGVLFLVIFFESFPLTFFLPGDSLLFTTGFLASQGYLNLGFLVLILFIASVLGYVFSYLMGEKLRNIIVNSHDKYWFKMKHLEYTEGFFKKYANKTLILGRFVPIVRSFAPTLAGAVKMSHKTFLRDAVAGGILWTGGLTLIGFYLGRTFPGAHKLLMPVVIIIVLVSLTPAVIEFVRSRTKK